MRAELTSAGLRLVVPFLEDVETAIVQLTNCWSVAEIERKSETLSFREFAYDAAHLILRLPGEFSDSQLPPGVPEVCEVQVRTYLQEAWAEVEHELIYKSTSALPDAATQKKLAALNATLMLSDTVFQELRDHQKQQARWGRQRFHELRKKAAAVIESPLANAHTSIQGAERWFHSPAVSEAERLLLEGIQAHNHQRYQDALSM